MSRDTERVEIRDAGFDDVREIQRVARTTWDHTYYESTPEGVRREFVSQAYSTDSLRRRMESNAFLVAAEGEDILGFADFRPRSGTQAELAAIYVLPEMQGRGSERASSQPATAGSRPLRDSCCGWSRTTHRPNASTRPTGSGASGACGGVLRARGSRDRDEPARPGVRPLNHFREMTEAPLTSEWWVGELA